MGFFVIYLSYLRVSTCISFWYLLTTITGSGYSCYTHVTCLCHVFNKRLWLVEPQTTVFWGTPRDMSVACDISVTHDISVACYAQGNWRRKKDRHLYGHPLCINLDVYSSKQNIIFPNKLFYFANLVVPCFHCPTSDLQNTIKWLISTWTNFADLELFLFS